MSTLFSSIQGEAKYIPLLNFSFWGTSIIAILDLLRLLTKDIIEYRRKLKKRDAKIGNSLEQKHTSAPSPYLCDNNGNTIEKIIILKSNITIVVDNRNKKSRHESDDTGGTIVRDSASNNLMNSKVTIGDKVCDFI